MTAFIHAIKLRGPINQVFGITAMQQCIASITCAISIRLYVPRNQQIVIENKGHLIFKILMNSATSRCMIHLNELVSMGLIRVLVGSTSTVLMDSSS